MELEQNFAPHDIEIITAPELSAWMKNPVPQEGNEQ
jgi:hypothetical protein